MNVRQQLISATLVALLAGTTGALADCAAELAQLTQDSSTAPADAPPQTGGAGGEAGATGEGEDKDGGTFSTFGQEGAPEREGDDPAAAQASGGSAGGSGDRAAALQRARAALDAGDEAACMQAVEEARAM
jgi:hypothetical protein